MNLLDIAGKHTHLKKASATAGGEYQGPCPGCGGSDRFHVWPERNEGRGYYWCRQCGKWGDDIQFLRDFEGMSFQDACNYLGRHVSPQSKHHKSHAPKVENRPDFEPKQTGTVSQVWQERAEKLVAWAHEEIWKQSGALAWLAKRGITAEMITRHRLGWNIGEKDRDIYRARSVWGLPAEMKENGKPRVLWIPRGLVIPAYIAGTLVRIRIRREEDNPKYYILPGSSPAMMILGPEREGFVVVEAELDAILCSACHPMVGAIPLGSVAMKPDEQAYRALRESRGILVGIDFDKAGAVAVQWWLDEFRQAVRWPVPQGKDPGEAYALGVDIGGWIRDGLPPVFKMEERQLTVHGSQLAVDDFESPKPETGNRELKTGLSPTLQELYDLLRRNPQIIIINTPNQLALLRNKKYVGGRIAELVFRVPEVTEYILAHPAEKITGENFII